MNSTTFIAFAGIGGTLARDSSRSTRRRQGSTLTPQDRSSIRSTTGRIR